MRRRRRPHRRHPPRGDVVAAFFLYGLTEVGAFGRAFAGLGRVSRYAGGLNAALPVPYRALDDHHALAADP